MIIVIERAPMSSDIKVEVAGQLNRIEDQTVQPKDRESPIKDLGSSSQEFHSSVLLSPAFRSAAAMAGWDAETLLLAALNQSPVQPGANRDRISEEELEVSCAARKRDQRTPVSSARRNRRVRWEGSNGSPLGRVPMKPLPLLSDSEGGNSLPLQSTDVNYTKAEERENFSSNLSAGNDNTNLKLKEKDKTPTKPACLDQLREELSCAVCLEICLEPSTISCGHSFCRICLQSVLQKCGPRCPKCRQPLRNEGLKNCRINTVLWNTIQILFPTESAARIQDQQRHLDEEASKKALKEERNRGSLGTRPSRLQPWRSSPFSDNVNGLNFMGNLSSSFEAAPELILHRDDGASTQQNSTLWVSREDRQRQARSTHSQNEVRLAPRSRSSRRQSRALQERVDEALASRLQQAELNAGPDIEEVLFVDGLTEIAQVRSHPSTQHRHSSVTAAAANLRTVASRTVRHHRMRTRS